MGKSIKIVALDADDTLWENEEFFRLTQDRFEVMLAPYTTQSNLHDVLLETERKNLQKYGYGIKGFTLSMIETALEISHESVPQSVISSILQLGQDMLDHPLNLLPQVAEIVPKLADCYSLFLITKGDLLHQEQKFARSGLVDHFDRVEIVSEKTVATYTAIFGPDAAEAVMIGNSMKSDIVPALAAGARAIHVPAKFEWDLEKAADPIGNADFFRIGSFADLPKTLEQMQQK